ncbi:hypothetical protein PJM55_29250, partial [Mycobacterium kansasii]
CAATNCWASSASTTSPGKYCYTGDFVDTPGTAQRHYVADAGHMLGPRGGAFVVAQTRLADAQRLGCPVLALVRRTM